MRCALLCLALLASACQFDNNYGLAGCSSGLAPLVPNFWAGDHVTDVTFLAFGDPALDVVDGKPRTPANAHQVDALNNAARHLEWSSGEPVERVRGVLIAGSLSRHGQDIRDAQSDELGAFSTHYGLCGNAALSLPVYEGYGLSDYYIGPDLRYRTLQSHPVVEAASIRNTRRVGIVNQAQSDAGHYSWDWDNLHLVQLNLRPSNVVPARPIQGFADPRRALTFLQDDLARFVDGTEKRVVIIADDAPTLHHWEDSELQALASTLAPYRVIAYLYSQGDNAGHTLWNNIPLIDVGSPNPAGSQGAFTVFRIQMSNTAATLMFARAMWNDVDPAHPTFPSTDVTTLNL